MSEPPIPLIAGTCKRAVGRRVGLGAERHRMREGVLRIDDPPGHRRRAGAVRRDEAHGERAGLGIEHVVDVALPVDRDVLGLVLRHRPVAHAREEARKLLRLRVGEFDELEAVGPDRIVGADGGGRCVVRERTHGCLRDKFRASRLAQGWRKLCE